MQSRTRIGTFPTLILFFGLATAGCGGPDTESLVELENAERLSAYAFRVTNVTDSPISGVHLLLNEAPSPMPPMAPRHWAGNHDSDGLHFVTPSPDAVGSRSKRPVLPGKSVGTFRFCLNDEKDIDGITLEHPDGSTTTAPDGSITVGEMPVESGLRPERDVYSFTLQVSAPENRPVSRVQFEVVGEGVLDGVVTTSDWRVAPSSRKATCWAPRNRTPISAGASRSFTLCADRPMIEITWALAGDDQIAVADGKKVLAFASP